MGEVFLPQVTDGYCRFSQHFSGKDVRAYGGMTVGENLFGWFSMHHQGKPGQPPCSFEVSPYQVARSGLVKQCPQIKSLPIEMEYLGYIFTRTGIKPQTDKVQTILAITTPKQVKDLHLVLGMVLYSRDLWAKQQWNACPTHLFDRRMQPYQSHQSQEDPELGMALGWPTSSSIWQRKGYYHEM